VLSLFYAAFCSYNMRAYAAVIGMSVNGILMLFASHLASLLCYRPSSTDEMLTFPNATLAAE